MVSPSPTRTSSTPTCWRSCSPEQSEAAITGQIRGRIRKEQRSVTTNALAGSAGEALHPGHHLSKHGSLEEKEGERRWRPCQTLYWSTARLPTAPVGALLWSACRPTATP